MVTRAAGRRGRRCCQRRQAISASSAAGRVATVGSSAAKGTAVLPLPKKRAGIAPTGFTRRYARTIERRIGIVRREGLDRCLN